MTKMIRRTTLVVALVTLAALPLFASGQKQGSATGGSSLTGTLTVWHYFSVKSQVQELKDLAALYNKTNPNAKVDYVFVPYNQLPNKLVAASSAGSGPDVVLYNGPDIGQFVDAGALKELGSYWNGFAGKGEFASGTVHSIEGKIYGVQGYVNLLGLWYNKTILDKLGIKPPTTIAELTADLEKVKAAGYKGITLTGQANDQGEWQAYPWLSAYGWSYSNPSASSLEQSFGVVSSWVQKGYLSKIVTTWGQAEPFQAFTVGDVAFAENGNWQLGTAKADAHFNYGVTVMPAGSTSAKTYLGGEVESIGAYSKNPALAWDYLKNTYFSKAGQLICFKDVGSIPARKDAAEDPAVANDTLLAPFAKEVQTVGASYPPSAGTVTKVQNAQLAVAQQWSAVIAGQLSPKAAAEKAVAGVKSALSGQ